MNPNDIANLIQLNAGKTRFQYQGVDLMSVTRLIGKCKKPFDENGQIAKRCAAKEGVTVEEIQLRWKEAGRVACERGHAIHRSLEHWVKTGSILADENEKVIEKIVKSGLSPRIYSEVKLFSPSRMIMGICDLIEERDGEYLVHDLKTNKKFTTYSFFGDTFLPPIQRIQECHLTTYSIQIILYANMLKEHGFNAKPGKIFHVSHAGNLKCYECLPLGDAVNSLLDAHKKL